MTNLHHPSAVRWRGPAGRVLLLFLSGLFAELAPADPALAQSAPHSRVSIGHPYAAHIAEASRRFAIPERWIRAIMQAESANDLRAVSPRGAIGLMQLMPATWGELRSRHRLGSDPFNPRDNILAGAAYLREMLDRYGTVEGMLAAYNAGPARYDEYVLAGRALPAETRAYVAALAPPLGGSGLPDSDPATRPRSTDWREAPLFTAPAERIFAALDLQPQRPSATASASDSSESGASPPPADALFVTRSTGDRSP